MDVYLRRCVRAFALLLIGLLLLAACSATDRGDEPATQPQEPDLEAPGSGGEDADGEADAEQPGPAAHADDDDEVVEEATGPQIDPAEVGADELGLVPVLMYHQLRDGGGSDWDMSPEEFRAELEYLFDNGYVPIRTIDLVRGEIDIPAGTSPVVLTLDDSTRSQAYLDEDGQVAADTSVGILIDVASRYDDVEPIASLYVITSSLFGGGHDGEAIVAALHDLGIEIANHSHTHPILRGLSAEQVQEELATNVSVVRSIVSDAEVATLSLPLGIFPDDPQLATRGEHGDAAYEHEGILLVGYNPAPSPFHGDFDALQIPRIQTHPDPEYQFGSSWWLEQFEIGEGTRRYVSDGDPTTISFPAERGDDLDPAFEDRANPY